MVIHHSCYTYVNKQVKFIKLELFAKQISVTVVLIDRNGVMIGRKIMFQYYRFVDIKDQCY